MGDQDSLRSLRIWKTCGGESRLYQQTTYTPHINSFNSVMPLKNYCFQRKGEALEKETWGGGSFWEQKWSFCVSNYVHTNTFSKWHFKMKTISVQTTILALCQKLSLFMLTRLKTCRSWCFSPRKGSHDRSMRKSESERGCLHHHFQNGASSVSKGLCLRGSIAPE